MYNLEVWCKCGNQDIDVIYDEISNTLICICKKCGRKDILFNFDYLIGKNE